jgi:hypothetical protein
VARDGEAADYEAAMVRWRPRAIHGPVVIFSGGGEDFACDPAALWRPWIDDLGVHRLPGSHLGIVRDAESVAALAQAVDRELDAADPQSLRVLLATTFGWESACRLAVELAGVGCVVEAVAPPNNVVHRLTLVARTYRLGRVDPLRSLRRAIEESRADLVIPFDDRTRQALHRVYDQADATTTSGARLRELIGRSLGPVETYPRIYSRAAVMALAAESGLRCPPTAAVAGFTEILSWMEQHDEAAVLKTDGSWGGREVAVARDAHEAARAWRALSRSPSWAKVTKRLLVERDPWPLRARLTRRRPAVSVQAYVEGPAANVAAACVDGEMLDAVQAEVICTNGAFGPSTVIRVIDHPEMLATARAMTRQLGLTGLCGFDFVLEAGTGRAHLVEVNPRATPTAHLLTAGGIDLLTSLRLALGHTGPPPRTGTYPEGLVALFPQEMQRDPHSPFLPMAYHDVPQQCPELVIHAIGEPRRPAPLRALWQGHPLMLASAALFVAEAFVVSHGALALAGAVTLVIGALMPFNTSKRPSGRRSDG